MLFFVIFIHKLLESQYIFWSSIKPFSRHTGFRSFYFLFPPKTLLQLWKKIVVRCKVRRVKWLVQNMLSGRVSRAVCRRTLSWFAQLFPPFVLNHPSKVSQQLWSWSHGVGNRSTTLPCNPKRPSPWLCQWTGKLSPFLALVRPLLSRLGIERLLINRLPHL